MHKPRVKDMGICSHRGRLALMAQKEEGTVVGRVDAPEREMRWVYFCKKHSGQVDTVPKQGEDDEIDGGPHARANASLGADAVVHHLVPILTRQDLQKESQQICHQPPSHHLDSPINPFQTGQELSMKTCSTGTVLRE